MRDLPAGTFVVTVSGGGGRALQDITLAAGEHRTGLVFDLIANLTVRGRVVDAATRSPVPGMIMVVVLTKAADPRGTTSFANSGDRRNVSGDDGRFEVVGVAPGPSTLHGLAVDFVDSPYSSIRQEVDLAAGAPVVDIGDVEVSRDR